MLETDIVVPIAGSVIAGALIGLEREFRNRPAGLRTHTLVCLASSLMMLAAIRQSEWHMFLIPGETIVTDPTRMAHGILTGIGFLCAGVIFREGFSVQGLTTASSLWLTSALGLLFGVGMYPLAVAGTLVTLIVLSVFRLLYRTMPRQTSTEITLYIQPGVKLPEEQLVKRFKHHGLASVPMNLSMRETKPTKYQIRVTRTGEISPADLAEVMDNLPFIIGYEFRFQEEIL